MKDISYCEFDVKSTSIVLGMLTKSSLLQINKNNDDNNNKKLAGTAILF